MLPHREAGEQPEHRVENGARKLRSGEADARCDVYSLAATFYRLWKNPDQRRELAQDRSLVQDAFLEGLRIDTPTQHLGRTVTKEVEFHGRTFRPGQKVMMMFASANRDEREFESPDEYRMKRRPPRMLAFGHGVHKCLGMYFGIMQIKATMHQLLLGHRWSVPDGYEMPIDWTSLRNGRAMSVWPSPSSSVPTVMRAAPSMNDSPSARNPSRAR